MIYLRFICLIASVFFFLESTYAVSLSQASATVQGEQVILTLQFNKGANARYAFGSIYPTVNNYGLGYRMNANCSVSDNQVGIGVVRSIGCQRALFPQGNFLFNVAVIDVSSNPPPPGYRIDKTISVPIDNTPKLIGINLPTVITVPWLPLRGIISFPGGGQFSSATHKGNATVLIDIKNNADPTRTISFTFSTLNGLAALPNEIDLSKQYMNIAQLIDGDYTAKIRARAINGAIASTTLNFQIKRSPTVYIALDKTQASGCETLTGSLTVNDPSGQGGMVALSLPDGTSSSFTYTGSAPAPIPFSYSVSEPVGSTLTFSATASSNSGASSKQPAIATANVIAGGLNVTITPAKLLLEPRLRHRADVKPSQVASAYKTPVDILVTDMFGAAVTGASVSLSIQTVDEGFGGHDHGNWLPPKLIIPKPKGIIFPASGSTVTGHFFSEYIGNEISSLEKIVATVHYQGCSLTTTSSTITSEISNLTQLVVNSPHFKIGGTDAHHGNNWNGFPTTPDNNHWVSANTATNMSTIMTEYPKQFGGAGLYINDASLPKGGRFDTKGNWLDPHQTHRRGIDIDVHITDTSKAHDLAKTRLDFLNDKAGKKLFF